VGQRKNEPSNSPSSNKSTLSSLSAAYRNMAPYLNIGYFFAASVTLFTLLGYYLDTKWQTSPWVTLGCAILGIGMGFFNFLRTVSSIDKKESND